MDEICCLCLSSRNFCDIHELNSISCQILAEMFEVQVDKPDPVCVDCVNFLDKVVEFKEKSQRGILKFRAIVNGTYESEDDSSVSLEPGDDSDSDLSTVVIDDDDVLVQKESEKKDESDGRTNIVCFICNIALKSVAYLMVHNEKVHADLSAEEIIKGNATCPICKGEFASKQNVYRHVTNIHRKSDCDRVVQKVSPVILKLKKKKNVKSGNRKVYCYICYAPFGSRDDVDKHCRIAHKDLSFEEFERLKRTCSICGIYFARSYGALRHRSRKHPDLFSAKIL